MLVQEKIWVDKHDEEPTLVAAVAAAAVDDMVLMVVEIFHLHLSVMALVAESLLNHLLDSRMLGLENRIVNLMRNSLAEETHLLPMSYWSF